MRTMWKKIILSRHYKRLLSARNRTTESYWWVTWLVSEKREKEGGRSSITVGEIPLVKFLQLNEVMMSGMSNYWTWDPSLGGTLTFLIKISLALVVVKSCSYHSCLNCAGRWCIHLFLPKYSMPSCTFTSRPKKALVQGYQQKIERYNSHLFWQRAEYRLIKSVIYRKSCKEY